MRKIIIICVFCLLISGCNNPISSEIRKEGDQTRDEMQAQLTITKDEIYQELQKSVGTQTKITSIMLNDYFKYYLEQYLGQFLTQTR